ncbi:class I SAM-dependent methyltransferase [Accumulibacter sp.]|uniref:class I SAM-dependent methyltransferase n=2 Tax=Accumulibacter sp. TaxID=2053492 RepID=UPI0025DF87D5|nr:class I SAM-dependent methyltransferase [Accumulibacter sp.]MCM8595988.1 class I SAM-dependent methyltransferase [Accumulibacter sp.]MDS4050138.1 class I SAM-dependent methyltransferase [Accumulibacter sp.]
MTMATSEAGKQSNWDHSSNPEFLDYYGARSLLPETVNRFTSVRDKCLALLVGSGHPPTGALEVVDIGCGAGTQCRLWASLGHRVHGLDVNAPIIEVARQRAREAKLDIDFEVGSATALPYADGSMDVSLLPELLEHVTDWETCLEEAVRVLRPGGLLYISTTNWLCPIQEEFTLPLYSWYPGFLKRHYERLAVTTRPEITNHAKYPAVHWFSYYQLASWLEQRGFRCFDRFALIETEQMSWMKRAAVGLLRAFPPARLAGHALTSYSVVFALRQC